MFLRAILFASALVLSPPSFANTPVPPEKSAYVGEWKGEQMWLRIRQEGKVEYKLDRPGKRLNLTVDLQGFDGDNCDVGMPLVRSTFVVSRPPHVEHGKWTMVVDGVTLAKVDERR